MKIYRMKHGVKKLPCNIDKTLLGQIVTQPPRVIIETPNP